MPGLPEGEEGNRHSGDVGDEPAGERRGNFHTGILRPARLGNDADQHPDEACEPGEREQETRKPVVSRVPVIFGRFPLVGAMG